MAREADLRLRVLVCHHYTAQVVFLLESTNVYDLMKVSKSDTTTYYQYCPMVKANWLSKEAAVKNPYYGASMLTCGSTVETIN